MPTFSYEVTRQGGQRERGTREGESAAAVARELRAQGCLVVKVRRMPGPAAGMVDAFRQRLLSPLVYPASSKARAMFFTALRALVSAGVGISDAMRTLSRQTENRILARAAAEMSAEALAGRPMSRVMARYPGAFPPVTVAVMEAGEHSGMIDDAAARLAKYFDRGFELEQAYRWHTFYPKLLLIALIVLPTVPQIVLRGPGEWFRLLLSQSLPIVLAVVALWYGSRLLRLIGPAQRALDSIKLSLPWFGGLSRRLSVARWARALAMLLSAGVPVHQALVMAASACGNAAMAEALVREADGVLRGEPLVESLAASQHLPRMALDMLSTGERAGSIEEALDKIADYYELETDVGGKQTAVATGVVLYLLVGAAVGFVVISFWRSYFGQYTGLP